MKYLYSCVALRVLMAALAGVMGGGCFSLYAPSGDSTAALNTLLDTAAIPDEIVRTAPPLDLAQLERAVSAEVNRIRTENGLPVLAWSELYVTISRTHSSTMAEGAYFSHLSHRGGTPSERALLAGLSPQITRGTVLYEGVGENIYLAHRFSEYQVYHTGGTRRYSADWKGEDEIARHAVATWMQSPTHRANLLSPLYEAQAIGAALGDGATVFITQNLMLSRHAAQR